MRYIIAPSPQARRGLGVGFLYLTQPITAIAGEETVVVINPEAEIDYE